MYRCIAFNAYNIGTMEREIEDVPVVKVERPPRTAREILKEVRGWYGKHKPWHRELPVPDPWIQVNLLEAIATAIVELTETVKMPPIEEMPPAPPSWHHEPAEEK